MQRRSLLAAAAAICLLSGQANGQTPTQPPKDPLLESRRANLPKSQPWPISFFQPQIAVKGRPKSDLKVVEEAKRSISAEALASAQAYAETQKTSALLVWRNGQLEHAYYAPSTGPDTISHTYHMQHIPLILLMGMALAEGKIASLDTPAATYLPEWQKDERSKITIRNLLNQNAGLDLRRDAHYSDGLYSRDARAYWGSNTKDVIVNEYPAKFPPGTRFDYNYIVPEIMSVIVSRVYNKPYHQVLSEKLWKPLGNKQAYMWLNRPDGEAHVDAGLFSAPTDWLNLGILLAQNGRWHGRQLVPADFIAEMRKPSPTNPNFGFMYLGSPFAPVRRMATDPRVTYVVKSAEPFAAEDVFYIDGYGGQRVYVIPSKNLVVVRIGEVAREWDNSKLVNLILAGAQ